MRGSQTWEWKEDLLLCFIVYKYNTTTYFVNYKKLAYNPHYVRVAVLRKV